MSEEELAKLVTVDSLIGAGYALEPSQQKEAEKSAERRRKRPESGRIEKTMESTNSKYKIGDAVWSRPKIPPATRARRATSEASAASSA